MEQRRPFAKADLTYLANLCHNCGECLYACQFAPPHEFGINVPRRSPGSGSARTRTSWPPGLARRSDTTGSSPRCCLLRADAALLVADLAMNPEGLRQPVRGDFYAVVSHGVMVSLFGGVGFFVLSRWVWGSGAGAT